MSYGSEFKFLPKPIKLILGQVDADDMQRTYDDGQHKSYADFALILLNLTQDDEYRMNDDQMSAALHPFKLFGIDAIARLRTMQKGSDAERQSFSTKAQREVLVNVDADTFKMLHVGADRKLTPL